MGRPRFFRRYFVKCSITFCPTLHIVPDFGRLPPWFLQRWWYWLSEVVSCYRMWNTSKVVTGVTENTMYILYCTDCTLIYSTHDTIPIPYLTTNERPIIPSHPIPYHKRTAFRYPAKITQKNTRKIYAQKRETDCTALYQASHDTYHSHITHTHGGHIGTYSPTKSPYPVPIPGLTRQKSTKWASGTG